MLESLKLFVFELKRKLFRLKLETKDRSKIVSQLREESRKQYLAKRKDDKLDELEKIVEDDEHFFANEPYVLFFSTLLKEIYYIRFI